MKKAILISAVMLFTASWLLGQVLDEDFENEGVLPTGWTQEYISSTVDWTCNTGGHNGYPSGAHGGTYNALFYSGNYYGDQTKLITPELDLSAVTNPVLSFWHTQDDWSGDQDELRVYYKTSAGGTWTLIPGQEYTKNIDVWTQEEDIILPTPNSTYYIAFDATSGYGYGVCLDDVLVEAGPSCPAPSALYATNILDTQADFGWTENGSATVWNIEVGSPGFTPGTATHIQAYTGVTSNPYTGTGLTVSTNYEFYVQADCGARETSDWAGPKAFSTPCDAVTTFPFSENFDAAQTTPDCWINNDPTEPWEFDFSCAHGADYDHTTGSGNFAWLDDSDPNDNPSNFDTPPLDITSLTTPLLTFWYWIGDATTSSTLYIDIFDGTSWTEGVTSYTELHEWGEAIINISAYSSTATRIRFRAMEDVSGSRGDICIDDVSVYETPECTDPSAQTESNILKNSASLGWTENGSATSWDIELGTTGFSPTGTPTATGVTNPYTYGSLNADETYDWYVRADCGGGIFSNWVGASTFTTAGDSVTTFPWMETFTAWPPECWDLTGGTFDWEQYATTPCAKAGFYYTPPPNNAFMTSPTLNVSGLTSPELLFDWSHLHSPSYPSDELDVLVSDNNGATWTSVWNKTGSDFNSGDGGGNCYPGSFVSSGVIDLSPFGTSLLIRFNGISGYGPDLFVDNVTVHEAPSCPEPTAQTVSGITTTSAELGWTENGTATTWE
ncbi:MAG: choice-of-anchor J domain-containing protein, partial [Candidatus Cloacimonetes bacterium]|nr:choice-of-anchor J domain-containing protein [Candidatus Cloacimonadota bacterium]